MDTVALILDTATTSQLIHREGRDILSIQSDVGVIVTLQGRVAAGAGIGDVYNNSDTILTYTLVADEPRLIPLEVFGGLLQFQFVASAAVAEDVSIYIGFRDFR